MDIYEENHDTQLSDTFGPLGETILALVAAIRSSNDPLKEKILDGLWRNGVDGYTAMAMAKFVMEAKKEEPKPNDTNNSE